MKQHTAEEQRRAAKAQRMLLDALLAMETREQMAALLEDLCTPAEIEAMVDRWQVVPLIDQGVAYRDIHERTGVSVTTVGRVARCLKRGSGGYRQALEALK